MIVKVTRAKKHGWGNTTVKSFTDSRTRLGVPIDNHGNQITGLTPEDEERLEKAMNLDKGTLRRGSIKDSNIGAPTNYWTNYTVDIFGHDPLILDTDIPEHELQFKILLVRKDVAKDLNDLKSKPHALFVLSNDDAEAEKANVRGKTKRLAYTLFESLSPDDMRNLLLLYGEDSSSNSPAIVESKLEKYMEDNYSKFLETAQDSDLKDKVFITKLQKAGIVRRIGHQFVEEGTNEHLAYSLEEFVTYLKDKKNQGKLLQFKEALKRS